MAVVSVADAVCTSQLLRRVKYATRMPQDAIDLEAQRIHSLLSGLEDSSGYVPGGWIVKQKRCALRTNFIGSGAKAG